MLNNDHSFFLLYSIYKRRWMVIFIISDISLNIYRDLLGEQTAYIHSKYKNTINLDLNGRIISLQRAGLAKAPMSMVIDNDIDLEILKIDVGDKVKINESIIHIANYQFNYKEANIWNPQLDLSIEKEGINFTNTIIFLSNILDIFPKKSPIGIQQIKSLEELIRFIGSGIGLTPSGDDFIVGFLSTLFVFEEEKDLLQYYREELVHRISDLSDKTTFLGKEFLQYACNREFSDIIHGFYGSLKENNRNHILNSTMEILKLGHSSGADTLSGIVSGLIFISELKMILSINKVKEG